jgi:hypothetical protein
LDLINILVKTPNIKIVDSRIQEVPCNILSRKDGFYDLYFLGEAPAVGYDTYYSVRVNESSLVESIQVKDDFQMENEFIILKFKKINQVFVLDSLFNKFMKKWINLKQQLLQYTGLGSGAYIFSPKGDAEPIEIEPSFVEQTLHDGHLVSEFRQQLNRNITQIFKLYKQSENTEVGLFFEMEITSVIANDKELITRLIPIFLNLKKIYK